MRRCVEIGACHDRRACYPGRQVMEQRMPQLTLVYWRDIPAQIIAGSGRRAVKRPLPERFEQAIDRAAMRAGMAGTDAYLSAWRKVAAGQRPGSDTEAADAETARIDSAYGPDRLRTLIEAGGHDAANADA